MSDPFDKAKKAVEITGAIVNLAKDSPDLQEAGSELAKTALTLTKTLNVCLLPLAAINFGFEKARRYFDENFQADIEMAMKDVPEENIIEPKPSIAGPALQGLSFVHEEQDLKKMYLSLLKSAMDSSTAQSAHPAFAEIIRQIAAEEANFLQAIVTNSNNQGIAQLRVQKKGVSGYRMRYNHLLNVIYTGSREPVFDLKIPEMVDNWIRLGLIIVDYNEFLTPEGSYDWVEARPEFKKFQEDLQGDTELIFQKGVLRTTAFGSSFAKCVLV